MPDTLEQYDDMLIYEGQNPEPARRGPPHGCCSSALT